MASRTPEEQQRLLLRARRLVWVAFVAFCIAAVCCVVVVVIDPTQWLLCVLALALGGYTAVRNRQRLRRIDRALVDTRAEIAGQASTDQRSAGDVRR